MFFFFISDSGGAALHEFLCKNKNFFRSPENSIEMSVLEHFFWKKEQAEDVEDGLFSLIKS